MDLDVTFFAELGLLCALVLLMRRLMFVPMQAVIDSRHQKIFGTRAEASRLDRLLKADREAYQSRMQEARRAALAEREALRQAGEEEARRILDAARAEAQGTMQRAREALAHEVRLGRQRLTGEVPALARQAVSQLLRQGSA